jgi:hypothetical protein
LVSYQKSKKRSIKISLVLMGLICPKKKNSLRVDQISNMSSKALIVKGGVADTSKCRVDTPQFVYYRVAAREDLGISEGIWKKAVHWIYCPSGHKFSFVHDIGEPF